MQKKWSHRLLIIPPILIALAVLVIAPKMKTPPQKVEVQERATKVRFIKVPRLPILPRATGYGTAKPARNWEAVAEVSGQVTWLSDQLKGGNIIAEGSELLRIDDSSYRLDLTRAETQLNTLAVKQKTTRASLALEQKSLALLRKERDRKQQLHQQGALSVSLLEEAERNLLRGEASVQNLQNTLALNAAEMEVLKIQKASAELNLDHTRFTAPFDVRITELKINQAQYANKGQLLFSADGIDAVEVTAQFPIGKLRPLMASKKSDDSGNEDIPPAERIPGALKLNAKVRLKTATHTVEWPARVDRVSGLVDPQTQSIGVVVVIDQPYQQAQPGKRPALIRNTFVEVELSKKPKGKPIVIPASALHKGKVYLINEEQRLEIRKVKPMFIQGGAAVIAKGLEAGEKLIVSDLIPATEGMLVEAVADKKQMKRLKMAATGKKEGKK